MIEHRATGPESASKVITWGLACQSLVHQRDALGLDQQ
jgi:hypothetical protein